MKWKSGTCRLCKVPALISTLESGQEERQRRAASKSSKSKQILCFPAQPIDSANRCERALL